MPLLWTATMPTEIALKIGGGSVFVKPSMGVLLPQISAD